MKALAYLALLLPLALPLAGCQTTGGMTSVSVSPRNVQLAISSFDTAEVAAAAYLRLPVCGTPPCRAAQVSAALVTAVHDGRKIRAYVEGQLAANHGGSIPVGIVDDLQGKVALLRSILGN